MLAVGFDSINKKGDVKMGLSETDTNRYLAAVKLIDLCKHRNSLTVVFGSMGKETFTMWPGLVRENADTDAFRLVMILARSENDKRVSYLVHETSNDNRKEPWRVISTSGVLRMNQGRLGVWQPDKPQPSDYGTYQIADIFVPRMEDIALISHEEIGWVAEALNVIYKDEVAE